MATKKPLKKVPVSRLEIGMFLVDLDIAWIDSPFLTHNKRIKNQTEIKKLKAAGAKVVVIDPNRGLDTHVKTDQKTDSQNADVKTVEPQQGVPASTTPTGTATPLKKELGVAKKLRDDLTKAIGNLQSDIASNKPIESEQLHPLIDSTVDSLERNNQALMSLAHISRRSQRLVDHSFSVFCVALNIAQRQAVSIEDQRHLGVAALLHEAGWMNIPIELMGKRTKYTPIESKLIHKHPTLAIKSLQASNLDKIVIRLIEEHHELCDGSGYPNKKTADQLHPLSKILSIADSYDEMIHQLRDQPGMLPTNALRNLYLLGQKGIYDTDNIGALVAILGVYPVSSAVKLTTGEKGIIIEISPDNPLKPKVDIKYNAQGKPLKTPKVLDLNDEKQKAQIAEVIKPNDSRDDPDRLLNFDL